MELDDAVVLLLGAPQDPHTAGNGEIRGITRLEKLVFLLERETQAKEWLTESGDFVPYNFGPFSAKVYQAVDLLTGAGLVEDSWDRSESEEDTWEQAHLIGTLISSDRYTTRDFKLTDRGWRYYHSLISDLEEGQLSDLRKFKARFASLPLRQLVRYVYQRYETFTTNSLIKEEILGF